MVSSGAFSRDGTRVVSGSLDNTIRIWNAVTGDIERVLKGHSDGVTSVAFSHDGTRVVSGSWDNSVRIWNVAGRKTKRNLRAKRVLKGHSDVVSSVAFSRDGTRIVSGSSDRTVRIWNPVTGKADNVLYGHSDEVLSVAFSPDGTRVVSGSFDDTVLIWDTITGESISLPFSECFQFPDKSEVHHHILGQFHLFAPGQQEVSLSLDRELIHTDWPSEACCLPVEFRDFMRHAISGSKICLGYQSVLVSIVDLTTLQ